MLVPFFMILTYPVGKNLFIFSVGSQTAILQEWKFDHSGASGHFYLRDIASIPEGYACRDDYEGSYTLTIDSKCGVNICGEYDECLVRLQLMSGGLALNGAVGGHCNPIEYVPFGSSACSTEKGTWGRSTQACVSQFGGDKCFFCHGVANGKEVRQCLDRNGGVCNTIFQSKPAQGFCNLEFECGTTVRDASGVFLLFVLFLLSHLFE
eukprot:TRINITY_DN2268_c0_g1_i7.p1 TRINITY_DN2268_c0_g1~~TRINITY_DN2268_c0_g1_i7.p1  ORF type:complete len:208 (+),score=22.37 TRINITY_DN2268_c0_g1_i7:838-1461(+)